MASACRSRVARSLPLDLIWSATATASLSRSTAASWGSSEMLQGRQGQGQLLWEEGQGLQKGPGSQGKQGLI